jgi:hypothetical protein
MAFEASKPSSIAATFWRSWVALYAL